MVDEPLLTTREAARLIGVDATTLQRYVRRGLLTPTVVLPSGHLRWAATELQTQMRKLRERGQ